MAQRRATHPIFAAFVLLLSILTVSSTATAAGAADYSEEATLGDGVEGLDHDRTTPIEAEVWAVEQVGPYMLVGGAFLTVRDRSNYDRIQRPYLAAFDPTTGEYVPWFRTQTDGPVYDIVDLGNGRAVIAGEFTSVNGLANTEKVAVIDVATGLVDTSYGFDFNDSRSTVVRAVAIHGDWLYMTGTFSSLNAGGVTALGSGVSRVSLATSQVDQGWTPRLSGGGGWGIGTSTSGRVFVGGYFSSVNNLPNTETLVALDPANGSVVTSWNNGFPHDVCRVLWRETCGAVNGLAVANDRVFVAGAKHFWVALDVSDGTILADYTISNDGQTVDLVDGMIVVGCHCERFTSDEFPGISHRYIRIIDPVTLHEVASPTVNSRGAAGGWGAGAAADSCMWAGGNFSSTFVGGQQEPAWSLLRFCPTGGAGTNPDLPTQLQTDTTEPTAPQAPIVASVAGSTVGLTWAPSTDDSGQLFYLVYRDGELVGRTATTSFSDPLIGYDKTAIWQIAASDLSGNQTEVSARSTPVRIGARVNVAPLGTASQISDFDASTQASLAIDGDVSGDPVDSSISRTGSRPANTSAWWGLDLGQAYHVDSVAIFPRRDAAFQESNNRPRIYQSLLPIDAQSVAEANLTGSRVWVGDVARSDAWPRIDIAPISNNVQHLRLFGGASGRISFAEVRVFTTFAQPTPAAPAPDGQDPTNPTWKRTQDRGANSVLSWGGASDDTDVAYYEIYTGTQLVERTTERTISVGPAGQPHQAYAVIAFDAAGNAGSQRPNEAVAVSSCEVVRDGLTANVTWAEALGAERYVVRRSVAGGTSYWRGVVSAPDLAFADTDRPEAIVYSVQAKHSDAGAEATICSEQAIPGGLRVTHEARTLVVLNYEGNGQSVEIERDGFVISTQNDNWFTDPGLAPGTSYAYRVRFVGSLNWSTAVTATTQPDVVVAPLTACSWTDDGTNITLSWIGGDGADAVIVRRSVDGGTRYWRGRSNPDDSPFIDATRTGVLAYQVQLKSGATLGPVLGCQ